MTARSLACSVTLLATCSLGFQQPGSSKKTWEDKYKTISHLFAAKNVAGYEAMLAPSFVYVDDKGKTFSRAQFIQRELAPIAKASKVEGTVKVLSSVAKGDTVTVSYDWRFAIHMKGARGTTVTRGREVGADVWKKTNGKWLTTKTVVKLLQDLGSQRA